MLTGMRGQREGAGCGTGFLHPKCMGLLIHRAASDFVQPSKRPLRVGAMYVCVRASVNSSRNMHFGTRLVTSPTSFALKPCFNLK